jgi:hypothetical protein
MAELKIISNHHKIPLIYWYELTDKEKSEFDWIINNNDDPNDFTFFHYKNNTYCLSEFMRIDNNDDMKSWDGYSSDSFFSGILVKYTDDSNYIIAAWYLS